MKGSEGDFGGVVGKLLEGVRDLLSGEKRAPYLKEPIPDEDFKQRIRDHLKFLYGEDKLEALTSRLLTIVSDGRIRLQATGGASPRVAATEKNIILITYADTIRRPGEKPLKTLGSLLQQELLDIVTTVHILPFYPHSSDRGFAVIDYYAVSHDLGGWEDVDQIGRDFNLMFDIVLNHSSRENLWFIDFINGKDPGRNYYIEVDPEEDLSEVVRPRSRPLLSPVHTPEGMKHVWATFSSDQPDLNFENPDVLFEFVEILMFYMCHGAGMLRLDAVAYLWKEIGTSCIHLPETHEVIKLFRTIIDYLDPSTLLLTETNVPHEENISYFGKGDEAHLVYQFSLPPLLLYCFYHADCSHLREWLRGLSLPPEGCTYLNFTASHDGIGVRPLQGLVSDDDIQQLVNVVHRNGGYVTMRSHGDGTESPYELNITLYDALKENIRGANQLHVQSYLTIQAIALSLQGIPAIYVHNFIATPNDHEGVEFTGRVRDINRKNWDFYELRDLMANPASDNGRIYQEMKRLIQIRKKQKAFNPRALQSVLDLQDALLGYVRTSKDQEECIVCISNLTEHAEEIDLSSVLPKEYTKPWIDLISENVIRNGESTNGDRSTGVLKVQPYHTLWIKSSK